MNQVISITIVKKIKFIINRILIMMRLGINSFLFRTLFIGSLLIKLSLEFILI